MHPRFPHITYSQTFTILISLIYFELGTSFNSKLTLESLIYERCLWSQWNRQCNTPKSNWQVYSSLDRHRVHLSHADRQLTSFSITALNQEQTLSTLTFVFATNSKHERNQYHELYNNLTGYLLQIIYIIETFFITCIFKNLWIKSKTLIIPLP